MKLFILFFILLTLASCNSGGGGSSSGGKENPVIPVPEEPLNPDGPDILPTCEQPAATSAIQGLPFHAIGRKSGQSFYLICTAEQLAALASDPNFYLSSFELGDDIDLYDYYTGDYISGPLTNQFMIAPNESLPFKGALEGNGYAISDFRLFNSNMICGFFGYLENAFISNIEFESLRISSTAGVCGALAGKAKNSIILNTVLSYEDLSEQSIPFEQWAFVSGPQIAGFIAELDNSVIENSYSVVNLDSRNFSSAQVAGFSLNIINGAFIGSSFYDGIAQAEPDATRAGISLNSPIYTPTSPEDNSDVIQLDLVAVSTQSNLGQLCNDDANCGSDSAFLVNKNINPQYYEDSSSEIYTNWNLFIWNFNLTPAFPYPRLE